MLSMTRKTDYGLVAMAELARYQGSQVTARAMSERIGVPLPALTNVLKQLAQSGLVTATRGPRGGYRLAHKPNEITLGQLIEAVEGPVRLTRCCSDGEPAPDDECKCDLEDSCRVKLPVQRVQESLLRFLDQVKLSHIADDQIPVQLSITVGT